MSIYDDVNNNRLNLRNTNPMYQEVNSNLKGSPQDSAELSSTTKASITTTISTETSNSYIQINEFIAADHLFGSAEMTTKLENGVNDISGFKGYRQNGTSLTDGNKQLSK